MTIITFLMMSLIKNTQNREKLALQLKLENCDKKARNDLAGIEEETADRLEELQKEVWPRELWQHSLAG